MRTASYVLGILGTIFGFLALTPFFLGGALLAGLAPQIAPEDILMRTFLGLLATVFGLIGTMSLKSFNVIAAFIMISAAVIGFFMVPLFYILPSILFFVGGILAFASEENKN
jgi:membrane associated rhomboid family serine protease